MPDPVSLTTFVDFVSKSGTPKATVVRRWKHKGDYSVARDYYKQMRDAIVAYHRNGTSIDPVVTNANEKKRDNFSAIADGHRKWAGRQAGRQRMAWFEPASDIWRSGNLQVAINPELGLKIDGVPHLIKLYFKAEPLAKNRIGIITHLMSLSLSGSAPKTSHMGVLDLRRSKLITPTVPIQGLTPQLKAEAAYWNSLWPHV